MKLRIWLPLLWLCCGTAPSFADGAGMFLCRSPVVANDFWTDLNQAAGAGVKLNMDIARNIAQKNGCSFVSSSSLKPVDFTAGQMAITDGKVKGWAAPQLYIMYVNRPAN
ncbi:hypothetical protein [Bradyrhizobium elkanii]|nr:hypothetical protein [Bradyrhizobium elkanii]MCS3453893.1 hypothetical protein [Bradyrhizobium elkanii]MCS3566821.1 hypothetical protein [Bradyrhizobium elkanii]MCW2153961.1 hypothetical protein [Bradyrhizobium elkanii]MCW2380207.1 hypothetical protein [Bradyrhizobium elkanii]WLC12621.1 hypothetical protein QIH86_44920 [Bradyrhizobium elkanii USDA 94]